MECPGMPSSSNEDVNARNLALILRHLSQQVIVLCFFNLWFRIDFLSHQCCDGDGQDARDLEEVKEKLSQPTKWLLEQKTLLQLLTHLKVLSRKEVNRKALGPKAIARLLKHLTDQTVGTKIQAEGANVVLNICYEKENVSAVLASGGASTLVPKPNPNSCRRSSLTMLSLSDRYIWCCFLIIVD